MRSLVFCAAVMLSLTGVGAKADAPQTANNQVTAAPAIPAIVTTRSADLGTVYADNMGKTLYTFDRDTQPAKSACAGACANDWTLLSAAWIAKPAGDWTVLTGDSGSRYWAYKGKPVYTFSGDHQAGDVNGDGLDNAWHAVVTARKFLPAEITIRTIPYSDLGEAFTAAADGKTLYIFNQYKFNGAGKTFKYKCCNINPGPSACTGDCAKTWPPLKAPADAKPSGDWSVVTRDDGGLQWAYKGWPLYTYTQDAKPGDVQGDGVHKFQNGTTGIFWQVATVE